MIRAYDLQPDGTVNNMRVFHNLFRPGADGASIDVKNSRGGWVAFSARNRRALDTKCGIYVFAPTGALIRFIPIPEDTITNCALAERSENAPM
jgi:gluconolactonase